MDQYLTSWLAGRHNLRPATRLVYELHLRRYLSPHLGQIPLATLTLEQVDRRAQEREQHRLRLASFDVADDQPQSARGTRSATCRDYFSAQDAMDAEVIKQFASFVDAATRTWSALAAAPESVPYLLGPMSTERSNNVGQPASSAY